MSRELVPDRDPLLERCDRDGVQDCGSLAGLMRRLLLLAVPLSALALTATATGGRVRLVARRLPDGERREADGRHRQPGVPAVVRAAPKGRRWKINDPDERQGLRERGRLRGREAARLREAEGEVGRTCRSRSRTRPARSRSTSTSRRSRTPRTRAKVVDFSNSYYDVNQAIVVLKGTTIASVHSIAGLRGYKFGVQIGTTSYRDHQVDDQADEQSTVYDTNDKAVFALKNKQIDGARRRPADGVLRHCRPGAEREDPRPVLEQDRRALRDGASRRATRSARA